MRHALVIPLLLLSVLATGRRLEAQVVLDQSALSYLGVEPTAGPAVVSMQSVAQTFTVGVAGTLARIDLGIHKSPGATGNVTVDTGDINQRLDYSPDQAVPYSA